jgi:hypothetical protein
MPPRPVPCMVPGSMLRPEHTWWPGLPGDSFLACLRMILLPLLLLLLLLLLLQLLPQVLVSAVA